MPLAKPRTQAYLWPISPVNLTVRDRGWLDKAVEKDYDDCSIAAVLHDAVNGYCRIWRMGNFEGVLVTEVLTHGVLWVKFLAGKGFLFNIQLIEDCLRDYAKDMGCKVIRTNTHSKGLQKIYSKRYKELTRVYSLEV